MKYATIIAVLFLGVADTFASPSAKFVCDMSDLSVDDVTTGLYWLQVSETEAVLSAGPLGETEVATLALTESHSTSLTVFLSQDAEGRIEHSFDLLPSGDSGILIWRNYDWRTPGSRAPLNKSVHICNKR